MNKSRHSCNRTQHGSIVLPDSLVTQLYRMSILFLLRVEFVSLWIDCSVLTPRGRSMLPLGLLSKGSRGQPEESLSIGLFRWSRGRDLLAACPHQGRANRMCFFFLPINFFLPLRTRLAGGFVDCTDSPAVPQWAWPQGQCLPGSYKASDLFVRDLSFGVGWGLESGPWGGGQEASISISTV